MAGAVVSAISPGSFAAVASAGKAFIISHPIGMAMTGGALLGTGSYILTRRYFAKRKLRKESAKEKDMATA